MAAKTAQNKAMARLSKEITAIERDPPPEMIGMYLKEEQMQNLLFALLGPEDTPFSGGVYVLQLSLPKDYPYSAPDFRLMTPSGRFAQGQKICTSFSAFHPESWTPSYTLRTLILSFVSFFAEGDSVAAGMVHATPSERKKLASVSLAYSVKHYGQCLPVLKLLPAGLQSRQTIHTARFKAGLSIPKCKGPADPSAGKEKDSSLSARQSAPVDLTSVPVWSAAQKRLASGAGTGAGSAVDLAKDVEDVELSKKRLKGNEGTIAASSFVDLT